MSTGLNLIATVLLGAQIPKEPITERLTAKEYERVRSLVLAGAHCAREVDRIYEEAEKRDSTGHETGTKEKGVTA